MVKVYSGFNIGGTKTTPYTKVDVTDAAGTTKTYTSKGPVSSGGATKKTAKDLIEEARRENYSWERLRKEALNDPAAKETEKALAKENTVTLTMSTVPAPPWPGTNIAAGMSISPKNEGYIPVRDDTGRVSGYRDIREQQTINIPTKELRQAYVSGATPQQRPPPEPIKESVVGRIDSPQEARIAAVKERESRLQSFSNLLLGKTGLKAGKREDYRPGILGTARWWYTESSKSVVRTPWEIASGLVTVAGRTPMVAEGVYRADWSALGFGSTKQAKETGKSVLKETASVFDLRDPTRVGGAAAVGLTAYGFGYSRSISRGTGGSPGVTTEITGRLEQPRSLSAGRTMVVKESARPSGILSERGLIIEEYRIPDVWRRQIRVKDKKGKTIGTGDLVTTPERSAGTIRFNKYDVRVKDVGGKTTTRIYKSGTDKLVAEKVRPTEPTIEPEFTQTRIIKQPIESPTLMLRGEDVISRAKTSYTQAKGSNIYTGELKIFDVSRGLQLDTALPGRRVTRFYPDLYTYETIKPQIVYSRNPEYPPNVLSRTFERGPKGVTQVDKLVEYPNLYRFTNVRGASIYRDTSTRTRAPLRSRTKQIIDSRLMRSKRGESKLKSDTKIGGDYQQVRVSEPSLFRPGPSGQLQSKNLLRSLETKPLRAALLPSETMTKDAKKPLFGQEPTTSIASLFRPTATPLTRTRITADLTTPTTTRSFLITDTTRTWTEPTGSSTPGRTAWDTPGPPIVPGPGPFFMLPPLRFGGSKRVRRYVSKQPKKYTPSYAALGLGIKKKVKEKSGLFALGIRPIPK